MRVRLIFKLKNKGAVLPFHHQRMVSTLFNDLMSSSTDLENEFYCFSGVKGQTKVGREGLHFYSKLVTIVFTSLNKRFVDDTIKQLFSKDHIVLGNLLLEPFMVEEEINELLEDNIRFLCISPIVLSNSTDNEKNKVFIHPTTDSFSDYLYESTMERMERSGLYSSEDIASFYKFQVIPDQKYLDKISRSSKKFARIYTLFMQKDIREVRGYTFPFSLYADSKVEHFIYNCGIGELTHFGFGMLDTISQNEIQRKVIYKAS